MNETHQLNVWTTALNLPEYEVVHYAQREGTRHFSVVSRDGVELCPDCSKSCQQVHQKRWIEDVADLPLGNQPVRLKVRVFQYECEHCGRHFTPKSLLFTPGLKRESHSPLDRKSGGVDSAGGHRRGGGVLSNSRKDARTLVLRMGGIGTPAARRGGVHPADSFAGH